MSETRGKSLVEPLLSPLSADEKRAMQAAAELSLEFRASLEMMPARPDLRPDDLLPRFATPLPETGESAEAVIRRLAADAAPGLHAHAAPRFFGYVCGGSMPVGTAADFLVSAWGQNSASAKESPSVAVIEQTLCRWCLELLNLPPDCGVGVVTGGTVANTQAIIAARDALLARQGWDAGEQGVFQAPDIPVLVGADAHSAPIAGLRYAGFGQRRAQRVKTDAEGRICLEALEQALKNCDRPPLVILQAGQINTGAFDPFEQAIPMVHAAGGWVHVDGAFGLWLHAVPELRDRLAGVDAADSWAVDLHKWLNAPYDAGLCIVRNRADLVRAMTARGAYLPELEDTWEPSDSTLELSRRARGVPSYAIIRHLGADGVREMVARHCALAEYLAGRLTDIEGLNVVNTVASNQVAIACDTDEATTRVLQQVQANGKVYPSHGEWHGQQIIRVSIINFATDRADIDLLVQELVNALKAR